MTDKVYNNKILQVASAGAGSYPSPIVRFDKADALRGALISLLDNTKRLTVPIAGIDLDIEGFQANFFCQGTTGTVTGVLAVQGSSNPFDVNTLATAVPTSATTSLAVTSITGFTQNNYCLMMEQDGSGYEWVQATQATGTGAGSLTLVRAQYGTTARNFTTMPILFTTNSWVTQPGSYEGGATTMSATGTLSSGTPSLAAPNVLTVDSQALGLNRFNLPFMRLLLTISGTSPVVTAGYADLTLFGRSTFQITRGR